jgi:putative tryptophan/tyrosine transport system substrate-binding protein
MKRREFLALACSLTGWSLGAGAQQRGRPVIGFIHLTSLKLTQEYLAAFHQGLNETGYVEGRNVLIEYRWAQGHNDRMPTLIADLIIPSPTRPC